MCKLNQQFPLLQQFYGPTVERSEHGRGLCRGKIFSATCSTFKGRDKIFNEFMLNDEYLNMKNKSNFMCYQMKDIPVKLVIKIYNQ